MMQSGSEWWRIHMNRPSGEPRPGARALCRADHRHGVSTTYAIGHVTCSVCMELHRNWSSEQHSDANLQLEEAA